MRSPSSCPILNGDEFRLGGLNDDVLSQQYPGDPILIFVDESAEDILLSVLFILIFLSLSADFEESRTTGP